MYLLRKILLILLLVIPSISHAEWKDWSDSDKSLFVASELAMVADWSTTRYATRHWDTLKDKSRETNIFLGRYPNTAQVDGYFIICSFVNYYLTDTLPSTGYYRPMYLSARIYIHTHAAHKNEVELGWHYNF